MEANNMAAMREALIFAEQVLSTAAHNVRGETGMIVDSDYAEADRRCKSALAAPPRNCDRFGGDYNRLRAAWWDWTASPSGRNPDGTTKMSFTKWLLATATEGTGEMKRRVNGYMIYGCNNCKQGFRMYLETGLEIAGDGEKHKPVPFCIKCPFCGEIQCHDVAFRRFDLKQRLNPKRLPFFANNQGQGCGTPMNMEFARPEFIRKDRIAQ